MAILMYTLWDLWPKVSEGKSIKVLWLETISDALDRFTKENWTMVGFGCMLQNPPMLSGQIDVFVLPKGSMDKNWYIDWTAKTL